MAIMIEEIDLTKSRPESVLSGLTNNDLKKGNIHQKSNEEIKNNKVNGKEIKDNNSVGYINNNIKKNNNSNDRLNIFSHTNSSDSNSSIHGQGFPESIIPMLATL